MSAPGPLAALRTGGRRALAAALAELEANPQAVATLDLLEAAWAGPRAHVVGLTGPPGVGKSALLSRLIEAWRARGCTLGVIAVDPSSRRSGGALLGDRLRLAVDPDDPGVFVRSMAARERLGGLAALTYPAVVLLRAVFDRVVVETVGVGQSETDVGAVADTVALCVQPGSGDAIQYMKAGVAEVPDLAVVNKADLGAPAVAAQSALEAALAYATGREDGWQTPVLAVSATASSGIDALVDQLERHRAHLAATGALAARRTAQGEAWLEAALRDEFGRLGLERARAQLQGVASGPPFRRLDTLVRALGAAWSAPPLA